MDDIFWIKNTLGLKYRPRKQLKKTDDPQKHMKKDIISDIYGDILIHDHTDMAQGWHIKNNDENKHIQMHDPSQKHVKREHEPPKIIWNLMWYWVFMMKKWAIITVIWRMDDNKCVLYNKNNWEFEREPHKNML